jgi:hypothetical protein
LARALSLGFLKRLNATSFEQFLFVNALAAPQIPDGTACGRIVTASEDETARVWDAQTGTPLGEPLRHRRTAPRISEVRNR